MPLHWVTTALHDVAYPSHDGDHVCQHVRRDYV